jgi:hypothetical protein
MVNSKNRMGLILEKLNAVKIEISDVVKEPKEKPSELLKLVKIVRKDTKGMHGLYLYPKKKQENGLHFRRIGTVYYFKGKYYSTIIYKNSYAPETWEVADEEQGYIEIKKRWLEYFEKPENRDFLMGILKGN